MSAAFSQAAAVCPECGNATDASALSCARCGRLRYSAELEQFARQAQTAMQAGDLAGASDYWLKAVELLPEDAVQYRNVRALIGDLSRQISAADSARHAGWKRKATGAGSAAAESCGVCPSSRARRAVSATAAIALVWS